MYYDFYIFEIYYCKIVNKYANLFIAGLPKKIFCAAEINPLSWLGYIKSWTKYLEQNRETQ